MDTMNTHNQIQDSADSVDSTHNVESVESLNTFKAYDPQLAIDVPEGKRLVKCLYKTNKKTQTVGGINSYILVPDTHLNESLLVEQAATLTPYLAAFLQDQEDLIVKEHHKNGGKGFSDSFLSLSKILERLDATGQSNRLNKDKIEAWFQSDVSEMLQVAFAEKMALSDTPTQAEMDKLAQITEVYKAKFASLASGKTAYQKEEAELLQKALTVTQSDKSVIGSRFMERLEVMKTATSNDLLMAL